MPLVTAVPWNALRGQFQCKHGNRCVEYAAILYRQF